MSKIIFTELASKPPAPSVGQVELYVKTDEVVYIQDSAGIETPLGTSAGITSLNGDVSATGPGAATATVNFVGGVSAANVASGANAANAATSSNTPNTIVERDGSGNFSAGTITASLNGNATTATNATTAVNFTGSLSGDVTGTQSATTIASTVVTGKLLTGYVTGTNTPITATNSILTAFENLQAQVSSSTGSAITALTGDGTATGPGSVPFTLATVNSNIGTFASVTVNGKGLVTAAANLSGDATTSGSVITLDTVNSNVGSFGSSTSIPNFTVNAKGLLTAAGSNVVIAPAGTLTGTTLASNVVSSSLTSVGTITSGTWNGTTIAIPNGGTGQTTAAAAFAALSPLTNAGDIIYENSVPAPTNLPIGTTGQVLTVVSGLPAWASPATSGTVTSVALALPSSVFTVTGSPVTSSGTLTGSFTTQSANTFFAGPSTGAAATPTFRAIVNSDVSGITTLPSLSLPTTQLTGTLQATQFPALTGQVTTTAGSLVTTISTNTVTNAELAQMPAMTLKGNNTGSTSNAMDLTVSQVTTMLGDIVSIGTFDSQPASANGLVISSNVLYAQSASATVPGMVNNTTQTFSGAKTFPAPVTITGSNIDALTINTTSFVFDSTNNAFGINTQPSTSVMIDGVNITGASKLVQMTGYGTGSTTGYRGRFARGSLATPAAAQSGDNLSAISARGYGTSQFAAASTGVLNFVAGETFTNTSNLTYATINTTPTGSVTSAEAFRVASTGVTLGPQSASTAIHQINGGLNLTTKTITASTYTVDTTTTDEVIFTDSTSNAITITLPTATNGRVLIIQDKTGQAQTNHITVTPPGAILINGVNASLLLGVNYSGWELISDGTNWMSRRLSQLPITVPIAASNIDWADVGVSGGLFTKTLSANTTFTFSNATAGQTIVIRVTNTASNYTVTWPSMKWPVQTAPVQTIGAFSDVYTIIYDGTNYWGSYVQNF